MMARIGGESYRCRAVVLCTSLLIGAATWLSPVVRAEQSLDTPPLPSFSQTQSYREKVTDVAFYTSNDTQVESFRVGDETLAAVRDTTSPDAPYTIWHPATSPATQHLPLQAVIDGAVLPTASVELFEYPELQLEPYTADYTASQLTVRGSVDGAPASTRMFVKLMAGDTVLTESELMVRGASFEQTLPLTGVATGEYTVVLHAVDAGVDVRVASTPVRIVVTAPELPVQPADTDTTPIPVGTAYVEQLELQPVAPLSTTFSVPVAPRLVAAISSSSVSSQPVDIGEVRGVSTQTFATPDRTANPVFQQQTDTPLAASGVGWSILGIPWYWWVSGAALAWVGVMLGRWWLR